MSVLNPVSILLVSDDPDTLEIMTAAALIACPTARLRGVRDDKHALDMIKNCMIRVDLILVDLDTVSKLAPSGQCLAGEVLEFDDAESRITPIIFAAGGSRPSLSLKHHYFMQKSKVRPHEYDILAHLISEALHVWKPAPRTPYSEPNPGLEAWLANASQLG